MSEFIPFTVDDEDFLPLKRHRQSKDEALYGVFNSHESAEEDYDKPVKFAFGQKKDREIGEEHKSQTEPRQKPLKVEDYEKLYGKGLKFMQKKGFQLGNGIGKNGQGRIEPVEISRRGKKEGLSFSRPENTAPVPAKLEPPKWSKRPSELIKPKQSIQEVREDLQEKLYTQPGVLSSIIDMRSGVPTKIVDFTKLNDPHDSYQTRDSEAQELIQMERKIQTDKDTLVALEYEEKQLELSIAKSQSILLGQVEAIEYLSNIETARLDVIELLDMLKTFEHNWPLIAEDYGLRDRFALVLGADAFKRLWSDWRFEEDPMRGFQAAKLWTGWLQTLSAVLFEPWQVQVVLYISTRWNPKRELGELDSNLKLWQQILPTSIWEVVGDAILHKLQSELEAWDPRTSRLALHIWIHPWLALLDLSELWQNLVPKLGKVLTNWHPADPSAHKFLKPWAYVLGAHWENLLKRSILPKLVQVLHEVPLETAESEMLDYVLMWLDIFPSQTLLSAIMLEFYPRWRSYLKLKLIETNYDLDAVQVWYSAWQQRLPILDLSRVFTELGL